MLWTSPLGRKKARFGFSVESGFRKIRSEAVNGDGFSSQRFGTLFHDQCWKDGYEKCTVVKCTYESLGRLLSRERKVPSWIYAKNINVCSWNHCEFSVNFSLYVLPCPLLLYTKYNKGTGFFLSAKMHWANFRAYFAVRQLFLQSMYFMLILQTTSAHIKTTCNWLPLPLQPAWSCSIHTYFLYEVFHQYIESMTFIAILIDKSL